ncbi:MAG: hypothetical protein HYV29_09010 [Ignavibacteriales bacterium]|nr:hypothetical protein [Ignavibacteriales bacterium]
MKKSSMLFLVVFSVTVLFAQQRPATRPTQTVKPADQTQQPSGKWFGVVFSDVSYIVQEPKPAPNSSSGTSGRNSFDLTRVQIGYDHTFNKEFSARVVYDPHAAVLHEGNIQWSNIFPMHTFVMGKMQTAAEQTAEKVFGYRSLGPMLFTRKGYAPEFDLGVSLSGKLDPQGMMYYSLGVANGTGSSVDSDKIKKFSFNFGLAPDRASALEVYADYENFSLGRSVINGKMIYGVYSRSFALGVEGFYRMQRKFAGTKDITPAGGSVFTWFELTRGLRSVVRIDGLDQDLNNDGPSASNLANPASYREVYVNVGLDYTPISEVHFIPNVVYSKQLEKGSSPVIADYIAARLTAAVYFK